MRWNRLWIAVALLSTVILSPSKLPGCGPFFERAIFVGAYHPSVPLKEYAAGHLGVLQPTYWRKYLVVAYRSLSGNPLSEQELRQFVAPATEETDSSPGGAETDPVKEWLEARAKVTGGQMPSIQVYKKLGSGWQFYLNCGDDAFRTAIRTLGERVARLGATNPGIKNWIQAQDSVFCNCAGDMSIPPAAEAGLPAILEADRRYQIAAAYFYAGQFDQAEGLFRQIAADPASPWSGIAPVLVARCLIRKATVTAPEGKFNGDQLAMAAEQLHSVLKDKKLIAAHATAQNLLQYVELRLNPLERLQALAERLQVSRHPSDFRQNLTDYLYLMDRLGNSIPLASVAARQTAEITDWIRTYQQTDPSALTHSLTMWEKTKHLPWLLSSLAKVPVSHSAAETLATAALQTSEDASAYPTLMYHLIRLLIGSGKADQARKTLDHVIPVLRASLPASGLNPFLGQRLSLARNLHEFLLFAPRVAAGITYDSEVPVTASVREKPRLLFDGDFAGIFNLGLPLMLQRQAAANPSLPPGLHCRVVAATWVRAILLSDHAAARALAADLERCYPELKKELQDYLSVRDAESRKFSAAFLLLRFPGMSPTLKSNVPVREGRSQAGEPMPAKVSGIDPYRENWWCDFAGGNLDTPNFGKTWRRSTPEGSPSQNAAELRCPAFLTQVERSAVEREWKQLVSLGPAPDYLGGVVLDWAGNHPDDPRMAEVLHLVVESTRVGCTGGDSWRYSRDAFQLLHRKYSGTRWAQITKYWYR